MAAKTTKKPSGGANIKASGRSPVLLSVDLDAKQKIRMAAGHTGIPMSQFFISHTLAAAESILKKLGVSM
jgi:uncharacterized protein (DUF1778 family)